jgi:hypothetical protein
LKPTIITVSTAADSYPRRLPGLWDVVQNFGAVFADPKTLFGIRLGLAGLLSVYLSQLIRLGHANWAISTVLVLAPAQYVGAIAQRSLARVVEITPSMTCWIWQTNRLRF